MLNIQSFEVSLQPEGSIELELSIRLLFVFKEI